MRYMKSCIPDLDTICRLSLSVMVDSTCCLARRFILLFAANLTRFRFGNTLLLASPEVIETDFCPCVVVMQTPATQSLLINQD